MRTLLCLLFLGLMAASFAAAPAVLFVGGVHPTYVAKPLKAMGFEVDICSPGELAAKLATKQYNVAVLLANDPVMQQPVEAFLAAGGGVYVSMPFGHISAEKNWFPNPEWAAKHGATIRWEQLMDSDPANAYTDYMTANMSWSTQLSAPVNDGAAQVLTLLGRLNWWPPVAMDFSNDWTVAVRYAPSVKPTPVDGIPERLRPYIPKTASTGSQPLLGVRQAGAGRLALCGISGSWSLNPPGVCPTVEAMLSTGANGRKSDWLRVFANTFRWLAEPSLKAGYGGAVTPEKVLNPATQWLDHPPIAWGS